MNDYKRGMKDGMMSAARADLEAVAMRLAILEEDIEKARKEKWELVNKITLLESDCDPAVIMDRNESMTLSEKIERIKEGWTI